MTDKAIEEFLTSGGVIQQIKPEVSGILEGGSFTLWGAPRKAGRPPAVDKPAVVEVDESDDETPGSA